MERIISSFGDRNVSKCRRVGDINSRLGSLNSNKKKKQNTIRVNLCVRSVANRYGDRNIILSYIEALIEPHRTNTTSTAKLSFSIRKRWKGKVEEG